MDLWEYYGESVPIIKSDDFAVIAAPLDFLGINYYDPIQVAHDNGAPAPGIKNIPDPRLERTADREIDALWLHRTLTRLQAEYPFDRLVITENGAAFHDLPSTDGKVHDPARIRFLQAHLDQVGAALAQGVPVDGYFIWSLLDNFEWSEGYSLRYGVVYVDFDTQRRIVKDSGWWYRDWIAA
jgi:beta-glucosidase